MCVDGADDNRSSMVAVYAQVGDNYRQIDDLRLRLLALLPLATGTGLLVLLGSHSVSAAIGVPVGVFGMVATLSLYFYELHGVEKCAHYIYRGAKLEEDLGVPGSFSNRPPQIFGVVSELLPSALIYPASFAGWFFLALYHVGPAVRSLATIAVLVVGAAASMVTINVMEKTRPRRRAERERDSRGTWGAGKNGVIGITSVSTLLNSACGTDSACGTGCVHEDRGADGHVRIPAPAAPTGGNGHVPDGGDDAEPRDHSVSR